MNQEYRITHPEGRIILMDGSVIDGFPTTAAQSSPELSGLQLDTTGGYLNLPGQGKGTQECITGTGAEKQEQARMESLFRDNAHILYHQKDRIYADSRMFLTPVDTGCNIAYTGQSGLAGATLGVWLEWWDALIQCRQDEKGNERLVWFFAGSPLSGSNRCRAVLPSGVDISVIFSPFRPLWSTFMKINGRYADIRGRYESYSLDRTLRKLDIHFS